MAKPIGQRTNRKGDHHLHHIPPDIQQTGHLSCMNDSHGRGQELGGGKNQQAVRKVTHTEYTDRSKIALETRRQTTQGMEKPERRVG